ncbi:hypothetical protein ACP4OV_021228 [Aristida adscensionis]
MASIVGSAIVQDTVSRVSSYLLSKLNDDDEMASRGQYMERLEMAHTELELALERSARMPITDVSLLRRRKLLKCAFDECGDLLHRCGKVQTVVARDVGPPVTHSFPKWIVLATRSSISSYFTRFPRDDLTCSNVRRFEWLAERANHFLRDVESGCLPQRYTFSNPLVRQLLEGKTLQYKMVQRSILRRLHIWTTCEEGRGVEAMLEFCYRDRKTPMRSFSLGLILRLSESTDIIGIAIRCLPSFTSSLKHMAEAVMRELTQMPLQDISHSYATPCFSIQDLSSFETQVWRSDPICCKENGTVSHISSGLSCQFPEQVIVIHVECYVSAFECHLHGGIDGAGKNILKDRSPLKLGAGVAPHLLQECMQPRTAVEIIEGKAERVNESLEKIHETVRSKAISCYIRHPDLRDYRMGWYSGHGAVYFTARKSGSEVASASESGSRSKTQRAAKRRRSK